MHDLIQSIILSQLFAAKFNRMKSSGSYFITVIIDTELDLVIGAGTIIVEQKFIHSCGEVRTIKKISDKARI